MNLVLAQYLEINLIGIVILLAMLLYILGTHPGIDGTCQRFFRQMLVCNMLVLLSDSAILLLRGHNAPAWMLATHGVCLLYFFLHPLFGYLWARYCIQKLYPQTTLPFWKKLVLVLPCLIGWAMTLSSPFTGWIYTLTPQNRYQRGSLFLVLIGLSFVYMLFGAVVVTGEMLKPKRIREHAIYGNLLLFPLPTLIGNLLQLHLYGLSIGWVCTAISLLILFINLQNYQLSRDMLTGLFNRRQTDKQISWELRHLSDANDLLFVIMADVDHFKRINDAYGHLTGDQALFIVADCLHKCCREKDFIGRFGGDEFIIIGHVQNEAEILQLIDEIHKALAKEKLQQFKFCPLSLSIGYQLYTSNDHPTADEMISGADMKMYQAKAANRQ